MQGEGFTPVFLDRIILIIELILIVGYIQEVEVEILLYSVSCYET